MGHVQLADFSLSKFLENNKTTKTFCGTSDYLSPEMILNKPYDKSIDWWSFGILIYEMVTGETPFQESNLQQKYRAICTDNVRFNKKISPELQDLILKLLIKDPSQRLGSSSDDYEEIQKHPFFKGVDFQLVYDKKTKPSWKPNLKNSIDVSNFDQEFTTNQFENI